MTRKIYKKFDLKLVLADFFSATYSQLCGFDADCWAGGKVSEDLVFFGGDGEGNAHA